MKEKIIKQMAEIVRDTMKSFQSDFYQYDMDVLKEYDEAFLWFVGESHTHLAKIGEAYLSNITSSEHGLFAILQRNTTADAVIGYNDPNELVFYYDGTDLVKISREEASHLWKAVRSFALYTWTLHNGMLPDNFRIPIKFGCSLSYVKEQLRLNAETNANLLEIFHRLRTYRKINSTHRLEIYKDFEEHSFTFAFMYKNENGEERCGLNGGIIYYSGKWNIHT